MAGFQTTVIIPPTTELHRKEIELRVNQLRDFVGKNERWFNSPAEVIDYLNTIGVRSTHGKRVTYNLLQKFRKHMGFPYATFSLRRSAVVTSNVLIMAWLWSLRVYRVQKQRVGKDLVHATAHLIGS
jgi:hypothetical protein